jgi:hypothetical protein
MRRIEKDVARLMPAPDSWSLLDGLLLGAVVGAAAAAAVIVSRAAAARRVRRQLHGPAASYQAGGASSPL